MTLATELEEKGFAKTGDIGGQPKRSYWTPDGREIRAMPDIHEYAERDAKGKVIRTGERDANLDKGWLTSKPDKPQLYCNACDKWHKTQEEIRACRAKKQAFDRRWQHQAKKELKQPEGNDRVTKLESEMSDIKDMLKQLLEKK